MRNDTGVYEGGEISIWYDPMIAKLVTHAETREAAIDAQAEALDAFAIEGIRHNIPFLTALMAHPRWRAGKLSTGFIAEEYKDGFHNPPAEGESAKILAAVAVAIDNKLGQRKRLISGQLTGRAVTRATSRRVWLDAKEYTVDVDEGAVHVGDGAPGLVPDLGETSISVTYRGGAGTTGNRAEALRLTSAWKPGEPVWSGTVNGKQVAVQVRPVPNGFQLSWRGTFAKAQVYTGPEADYARLMPVKVAADTGKTLLCPDARAGEVDRGHRGAGGQGGRNARRGRGDEDGKRAARRARRYGEEAARQGGRQPRGRCGDHGVCVSAYCRVSARH